MGYKNSAAWFQRCLQKILEELIYNGLLQYIDDTLLYGKDENDLLDKLEQYFDILMKHNVKLHPGKFVLYAQELQWCGKSVSADGIMPTQDSIATALEAPEPETLAELMSYVFGVAWFRSHLPRFAEVAAPLYDLWKDALAPFKRKSKQQAAKFKLSDLPNWSKVGRAAFDTVKQNMAEALRTAYFDPDMKVCVFADASEEFWCLVLTQCEPGDEKLPWDQQEGKHRLLFLKSGRFRHAQYRWPIVDKEAYSYGELLVELSHWINGGKYPAAIFTDHKNLIAIFDCNAREDGCSKPTQQRRERWVLNMRSLWYQIYHIDGDENRLADLGTLWGNRFLSREAFKRGMRLGPLMLMKRWTSGQPSEGTVSRKCALRIPHVSTGAQVVLPDGDADPDFVLPRLTDMVDLKLVKASQRKHATARPVHYQLVRGVWRNKRGEAWIPDPDKQLQHLLYAVAHQGPSGHRGRDTTLKLLKGRVHWSTMADDINRWRKACLQCVKNAKGDTVPRPLGTMLVPEFAGEILMSDYIEVGPSDEGFVYVLMNVDKMSKLVEFVPTEAATAIPVSKAILDWGSRYGLPEWLISDGGRHFANHAIKLVEQRMGVRQHITVAHCPWSNGSVEVVGFDLIFTLRCLLSEFNLLVTDWPKVLPLLQYAINHRPRKCLGDRCPIEVMTGRAPDMALDLVLWTGHNLKDGKAIQAGVEQVDKYCDRVATSIDIMHEQIKDAELQRQRSKAAKEAKNPHAHRFEVGDLIMVTGSGTSVNPVCTAKPRTRWQGPFEIVSVEANQPSILHVRLLGDPSTVAAKPVHWTRCKRFAGKEFHASPQMIKSAQHDLAKFKIQDFVAWRVGPEGEVQLLVSWYGFEDNDNTWENITQLLEDAPYRVRNYLAENAVGHPPLQKVYDTEFE